MAWEFRDIAPIFLHLRTNTEMEKIMIRDTIKAAQVASMKAGNKPRLAAVRLILAKLKDRDIELRTAANVPDDDSLVIDEFLPARMDDAAVNAAIAAIIAETGAAGMKDMGRVVGALKAKHGAEIDMATASGLVKAALSA